MSKSVEWSIVFVLIAPAVMYGAGARTLTITNVGDDELPVVDGLVTDAAWSKVDPYSDFIQQNPAEGAPASERTEVRLLLDRRTLYVGIINFDSDPERIVVTDSRRDGPLNETGRRRAHRPAISSVLTASTARMPISSSRRTRSSLPSSRPRPHPARRARIWQAVRS